MVRRVRRTRELYGFRFADVLLRFPDYDDYEMETTVLLDTLQSESPSLTKEEADRLFQAVMDDYAHITTKKERYQQLRLDLLSFYDNHQKLFQNFLWHHYFQHLFLLFLLLPYSVR